MTTIGIIRRIKKYWTSCSVCEMQKDNNFNGINNKFLSKSAKCGSC